MPRSLAAWAAALVVPWLLADPPPTRPGTGDAAFARRDFRKALRGYRAELARSGPDAANERRVVSCLAALEEWDEAVTEAEAHVLRHGDSLDGIRGRRLAADVYLRAPHYGVKSRDGVRRGSARGGGEPVSLYEEDNVAALRHLETARETLYVLEDAARAAGAAAEGGLRAEVIPADLALADLLQSAWTHRPMPASVSARVKDRYFAPRNEWAGFLRADDLYGEVVALGSDARHGHHAALAWYARALLWHRIRSELERLDQAGRPLTPDEAEALARPGDPVSDLRHLGERYPGDPLVDEALFAAARILEDRGNARDAEGAYEELVARHPASPWVSDSRAALQDMRRKDVSFQVSGPVLPGRRAFLALTARNVARVVFAAHRLEAEAAFLDPRRLEDARVGFADSAAQAGPAGGTRGRAVATWTHATGDDGSHRRLTARVRLPPLSGGAYLIEAKGEGVAFATLVVVSDLALVQKVAADTVLLFVADATTGKPVAGAAVVVKETQRWGEKPRAAVRRGTTGEDGTVSFPRADISNFTNVETLVLSGDRVAVSPSAYGRRGGEGLPVRVHVTTDRPVYRPGHSVHFRGLALRTTETGEVPLAGQRLTVVIRDAKRGEIDHRERVTDALGVFSGSLVLGDEPPLGEYGIEVRLEGEERVEQTGNLFRVEEYRKPEFAVSVEASGTVRAGERGRADVVARYHFGSPVANAAVSWRAFFNTEHAPRPFHDPHESLYGRDYWDETRPPGSGRILVDQGSARTDAGGRAAIEWRTLPGEYGRYDIEADVVDLSRRTVQGGGFVPVMRAAFELFLRADRGFYRPGETVTLEVASADAKGKPVPATGRLLVRRRLRPATHEAVAEETVADEPFVLDAAGRSELRWRAKDAGEYRLVAVSSDARRERVEGALALRVAEDGTEGELFRLSDVELTLERRTCREGETARVLVASSRPGDVLLTEEAGGRILGHRLVRLDGKGRVVDVALTRAYAPNVFLRATQVSEGQVFVTQREVFVPPAERLLSVDVRPRSKTVRPGESAAIDVTVRDASGRPVTASLSLAVSDRSIEAIQPPYAPDVRAFFYGERRKPGVEEASSFQFEGQGSTRRDLRSVDYRRHGMPPGWWGGLRPRVRDWAGDELDQMGVGTGDDGGGPKAARAAASEPSPEELATPRLRSNFADTAYWNAALTTDADGRATVTVSYPDSLTEWKVVARGVDAEARVGEAAAAVVARKDLMVRLQSPRFFVERDRALVAALVQNDLPDALEAVVRIEVSGPARVTTPPEAKVHLDRGGQARVEWPVEVVGSGDVRVRVAALTAKESDAAEQTFTALVHGTEKQVAQVGRLTAGEERELVLDVPAERASGSARLTLSLAPSLVSSLLEAVPYLIDYPYGCVEQTLSRFLPAVVLAKTLEDGGIRLEDVARGRRQQSLLPAGRGAADPVFDAVGLAKRVQAGFARLAAAQDAEGGWGWWKGDAGDVRMTAYVVYGLVTARDAGYTVDQGLLDRGIAFLEARIGDETSLHARAHAAFALAVAGRKPADLGRLFLRRGDLNVYAKALLALALQRSGRGNEARILVSNLEDLARVDEASDTASWPAGDEWWTWENDRVETQAFVLWALAEIRPDHPLAPKAARWLLLNRQGSQWRSTRDTAHAIYALAAFARAAGETRSDVTAEVSVGGATRTFRITPESSLAFEDSFVVADADLGSGPKTLRLRTTGSGVLYYAAVLRYFTKEEDISGAGTALRLRRAYLRKLPRVVEDAAGPRLEQDSVPVASLGAVRSGEEVEVVLTIESATTFDHLVFEDPKPAGFEPVDLRSGTRYGDGLCSNMELRDERVAFFITHLAQGTQVIRYVLRAETPGAYHALPARGWAMYAPEISALSDEWRGGVEP